MRILKGLILLFLLIRLILALLFSEIAMRLPNLGKQSRGQAMEPKHHGYPIYEKSGWWPEIVAALMVVGLISFLIGLSTGFL